VVQFLTAVALAAALALPVYPSEAAVKVIALSGDPSSDGSGGLVIRGGSPGPGAVLNDAGQVAFRGASDRNGDGVGRWEGLFRGDGQTLVQIGREGDPVLDGEDGIEISQSNFMLNDTGQVAFGAQAGFGLGGGSDYSFYLLGDGGPAMEIARASLPDINPDSMFAYMNGWPTLNNSGEIAFTAALNEFGLPSGIFRSDGATTVTIARPGQSLPGGNGIFDSFGQPVALNDAGSTAFWARINNIEHNREGIFLGNGVTTVPIALGNQTVPDGNGYYQQFFVAPSLNDANQVAFRARLLGVSEYGDGGGIFRGDGASITQIARDHQAAPDGNGFLSQLGSNFYLWPDSFVTPQLNNVGQVLFLTRLTDTIGGGTDDQGLFRGDGTSLVQIARKGQTVPGGNGIIEYIWSPALNDAGQVAFVADLLGTSGGSADSQVLYFFDDLLGLVKVARKGDKFLGSTIVELSFASSGSWGEEGSGFNERGPARIAYGFKLADGRGGVALWSLVPEPDSLALAALAAVGCAAIGPRRRRRPFDGR